MLDCLVCERIELIRQGENPYFVRELETGYVVIGDHQRFYGYTLFLCKQHATELHFLKKDFRAKFLEEMSLVAEAVYGAFEPDKLNYELLGAGRGLHMHWHFFPRRAGDTPPPDRCGGLSRRKCTTISISPRPRSSAGSCARLTPSLHGCWSNDRGRRCTVETPGNRGQENSCRNRQHHRFFRLTMKGAAYYEQSQT